MESFSGTTSTRVKADPSTVWDALTNPAVIRQYLFGTETTSDWKAGSSITWQGTWKGKPYVDKGTIVELVPGRLLKTTYFSGLSGQEDRPENYLVVTYRLAALDGNTDLTITVENNPTKEAADQVAANWASVLQTLKGLLER